MFHGRMSGGWMRETCLLFLALLAMLTGAIWFDQHQKKTLRQAAKGNLATVVQLQANRIREWRHERHANASVIMDRWDLALGYEHWLENPRSTKAADFIRRLGEIRDLYRYQDVIFATPEGKVEISFLGETSLCEVALGALRMAWEKGAPVLTDLHVDDQTPIPHLATLAPLFNTEDDQPAGAIILVSHARSHLYPVIQDWPLGGESGETFLVGRNGDHALVLSDLRFQLGSALRTRFPLDGKQTVEVMGARGKEGFVMGRDYRGEKVGAFIQPIPDTPWVMISKIDLAEVYREWRIFSFLLIGWVLAGLGIAVLTVLLLRQRMKRLRMKRLLEAEEERMAVLERNAVTLRSIGDAVLVTDNRGLVELLNPEAERLTGWREEDARGQPLDKVFPMVNSQTGETIPWPVDMILQTGKTVNLAENTSLLSKDGQSRLIADSGAPVKDREGKITGIVFAFRDITDRERMLKELDRQAALLRMAGRIARVGGWSVDLATNLVTWSDQVAAIHGKPPGYSPLVEEAISFYVPEWRAKIAEVHGRCVTDGTPYDLEAQIVDTAGRRVWVRAIGEAIRDPRGNITGVQGAFQDISMRKQTEEKLRESEARFRTLFEEAPMSIVIHDMDSGEIVDANPLAWASYGLASLEELKAHEMWLDPPFSGREALALIRQAASEGMRHFEWMSRKVTGEIFWEQVTLRPVILNSVKRVLSTSVDITDRKQKEAEILESQVFIKTVMDNLPIGLAVNTVQPPVVFSYMNDNFVRFYRTTREALANPDAFWEAVYENPVFREELQKRVAEDCASGDPGRMLWENIPIARKGEKTTFITAQNTPVPDKPLMISTVWDVTDKILLEERLRHSQKMESIGRLAGGVAHDFNNLIMGVMGYTDLARLKLAPGHPAHTDLDEIMRGAERTANLTRQLLAFARKQAIQPVPLNLNSAIADMLKMLERLIGENIKLVWKPARSLWQVMFDPGQLDQVLANLCVNARDSIEEVGTITIETENVTVDDVVDAKHQEAVSGDYVRCVISDDGCGMDSGVLEHIFEPFYTTKETGKGTGLGLATVYGIVRQSNGFINAYSELGKGSTFRFYIPRYTGPEDVETNPEGKTEIVGGSETVLLVEDGVSVRTVTSSALQKLGYEVLVAETPEEALRVAAEFDRPIHLLFTDMVMPGMGGVDLAGKLKASRPGLKCLFMSGYTGEALGRHGKLSGDMPFLSKPFGRDILARKLREVLDESDPNNT